MNVVSYSEAARMAGVSRQAINSMKQVNDLQRGKYPFFCHSPKTGKPGIDIENRGFLDYLQRNQHLRVKTKPEKVQAIETKKGLTADETEIDVKVYDWVDEIEDEKMISFMEKQIKRVSGFEKIGLPKIGEQVVLISDESFNAMTFLTNILELHQEIEELILSFYSFNFKAIEIVECLIDNNRIREFYFQTSNLRKYGSDAKIPRKVSAMIKKFGPEIVGGNFVNSHAKILLAKVNGNFYVVEGSGNMSEKIRTEQYLMDNSEELYNFHKSWITGYHKMELIK